MGPPDDLPGARPEQDGYRPEPDQAKTDFLRMTLDVCFTFANIAASRIRTGSREGAELSVAEAEKGYSRMVRLMSDPKNSYRISEDDRRELLEGTDRLRSTLDDLERKMAR